MEQKNNGQLPHLTSEIVADAHGEVLDAYALALEGWRRGLELKWYSKESQQFPNMKTWFVKKPGKLFSLSSEDKTHYFFKTRGDIVTNQAVEIGQDKNETKKWLAKAGVPIAEGKEFGLETADEEIVQYAQALGFPVVLKPTDGSFGRGVMTNLINEGALKKALVQVRSELNYKDVVVERYIAGQDYRLYVVGDQVVGAIRRTPANVIGDGERSILKLIEKKNEERKENPRLISCQIKPDQETIDFILNSGYTFDSVPEKGEVVFLTDKSNISNGGDSVDVLDEIESHIKKTAVDAVKAVPGLYHGGVDVIVDSENKAVVIELNPTAQIGSLLFPMKGQARDVPAAIIDFYFPETKGIQTDKEKVYFDFFDLIEPLKGKAVTVTTVSKAPVGTIYAKKYTLTGDVQQIGYHRGLRKQAFERKLSGFVKNLNNGDIEVVVIGTDKEAVDQFKEAIHADPERSDIWEMKEEIFHEPVKVGFEAKADYKMQVEQFKMMTEEKEKLEKELKQAQKQYRKLQESTSWKVTTPLRKFADTIKIKIRSTKR